MVQLDVPYREKDDAKALGAKWNYSDKHWYCEEDQLERFARWYHGDLLKGDAGEVDSSDKSIVSKESESASDGFESVTAVTDMIATYFLNNSMFQIVRVKGEVSNYSLWKGHHFFPIKDSASVLKCTLW